MAPDPVLRLCRRTAGAGSVCLFALLMSTGCSNAKEGAPVRAAVAGTVTLDGYPLMTGTIRFVPLKGTSGPKTSTAVSVGMFSLSTEHGPVVGKHRIEIESTDHGGFAPDDETALQRLREQGAEGVTIVRVPAIYNQHSQLVETVTEAGPNEYQFDLTTPTR